MPYECVSLHHEDEYPLNHGSIVSCAGLSISPEQYESHFQERHIAHSTALHSVKLPDESNYLVGPLARVNNCFDQLSPSAKKGAEKAGVPWPSHNSFHGIVARMIEVVHAFEEAAQIVQDYTPPDPSRVEYRPAPGEGCHATEAPRGLIYHRYKIGDDGLIAEAKIVPPTSQNQGQIESDLRQFVPSVASLPDPQLTLRCEQMIRNYDPCISCSTHFLKLSVDRT
jgi:coenzyme F420-reducing hydrogenase alpha subunit